MKYVIKWQLLLYWGYVRPSSWSCSQIFSVCFLTHLWNVPDILKNTGFDSRSLQKYLKKKYYLVVKIDWFHNFTCLCYLSFQLCSAFRFHSPCNSDKDQALPACGGGEWTRHLDYKMVTSIITSWWRLCDHALVHAYILLLKICYRWFGFHLWIRFLLQFTNSLCWIQQYSYLYYRI